MLTDLRQVPSIVPWPKTPLVKLLLLKGALRALRATGKVCENCDDCKPCCRALNSQRRIMAKKTNSMRRPGIRFSPSRLR